MSHTFIVSTIIIVVFVVAIFMMFHRGTPNGVQFTEKSGDGETAINIGEDGHTQIAVTKGKNSPAINIRK